MRTQLAIIAVSAFAVSAVCLGGAFALGGNAIGNAVFDFGGFDLPRCDTMGAPTATAATRALPWDGTSDRAAVALPANTHYQAGVGDQLVVKGDPQIIAHVRVQNGVVGLDCHGSFFHFGRSDRIDVTLPGKRIFRKFELLGTGDMQLAGLSQPEARLLLAGSGTIEAQGDVQKLNVVLAGSGAIEAKGKADDLNVDVKGSGKINLGDLAARNADIDIAGSGKVEVAPRDALNVNVAGSGTVYLRSEPKSIDTHFAGSGRIVHTDGRVEGRHHERHARADDAAIRDAALRVLENSDNPDSDALAQAKADLKARIRARVAEEIADAPLGDDDR